MSDLEYFKLKKDANGIVWLTMHITENERHEINAAFLYEFLELIGGIKEKGVKGLVICSDKSDVFLTGVESETLDLLANDETSQKSMGFFSLGNQLCRHIERLECPTIAIIEGECSGAGVEIAMACDYRIIVDSYSTHLSYPQIADGYHIGFGGITRLVRQLGFNKTLSFLNATNPYHAGLCIETGLASAAIASYKAKWLAEQWINQPDSVEKPKRGKPLVAKILPLSSTIALTSLSGNIKAPSALALNVLETLIDTWTAQGVDADAQHEEVTTATSLISSQATRNKLYLKSLLKTQEQKYKQSHPINNGSSDSRSTSQRIHILGSGTMGKYIAKLCALHGLQVSIYDIRHAALATVLGESTTFFKAAFPRHPERVQQALDNITLDVHNVGVKHADIIIESIPEDKHAKLSLLLEIDKASKQTSCIITTTSSIPLDELSKDMVKPERLVGLNLFNPLFDSTAVELMISDCVTDAVVELAQSFTYSIARVPIPVKSVPGFLSTRLLMAYLIESLMIYQSGVSLSDIEHAAQELGMAYTPFELIDELGLEECLKVAEALADRLGHDVPHSLMQKVEQGLKGKQAGEGFYHYKNGHRYFSLVERVRRKWAWKSDIKAIQKRLLEKMINECRECLNIAVVDHADWVDLLIVSGVGFSEGRGGALKYLDYTSKSSE